MNYRFRHIQKKLLEYSKFFKIILIVGARQVGKSTLLKHCFPDYKCIVFDPVEDLYNARQDPDMFLDNFPSPVILDEIQYATELLPAIKRRADENQNPGQYFLTGSQNLMMLKNVSESMAGRVGIINLDGLTQIEIAGKAQYMNGWLEKYLNYDTIFYNNNNTIDESLGGPALFLWRGTLPGILDAPDNIIPAFLHSYIQTYLERDVRQLENIKDLTDYNRFLRLSAALTAREINNSQLGRDINLTPKTARRWLDILLHSFQWVELPAWQGNVIKRVSLKRKGYFTDTGLICYLLSISSPEALYAHPLYGFIFETWNVLNILRFCKLFSTSPTAYHWRTNGGAEVDLVLEYNGKLFPIEVKCKTNLSKFDIRGISAFQKTYPKIAENGIIIYAGRESYKLSDRCYAIPWMMS